MDPITQGTLGAIASQNSATARNLAAAGIMGFLAGMSADLDVLIQSEEDPLLFLEYHRQFTHALVFIPVGGLLCSILFYWTYGKWKGVAFKNIWIWSTVGYATHALLDSCTSYGTQLFWPFTNYRVSWNNISIIDPVFTLPLLTLVAMAAVKQNMKFARYAAFWALFYLSLGVVQRERAESLGYDLAQSRNHSPIRLDVKPGFGNLLLWKLVYETDTSFNVDGIRMGFSGTIYPGQSIEKLDVDKHFSWLDQNSQQARDIERFSWFSDDFVAVDPKNPLRIIDIRYSMLPNEIDGLWVIELDPEASPSAHTGYVHEHKAPDDAIGILIDMLLGRHVPD